MSSLSSRSFAYPIGCVSRSWICQRPRGGKGTVGEGGCEGVRGASESSELAAPTGGEPREAAWGACSAVSSDWTGVLAEAEYGLVLRSSFG